MLQTSFALVSSPLSSSHRPHPVTGLTPASAPLISGSGSGGKPLREGEGTLAGGGFSSVFLQFPVGASGETCGRWERGLCGDMQVICLGWGRAWEESGAEGKGAKPGAWL